MLKDSLFISSIAFNFMKNKVLIFILIFLPVLTFSQNKNSISLGVGMLSERFSDQNLASLDFGGSGYDMFLTIGHRFNQKLNLKGSFDLQKSELSHELIPINLTGSYTGINLILYYEILAKNQNTFSLGMGYTGLFEIREGRESNLYQTNDILQGLSISPEYKFDMGSVLLSLTAVIPIVSEVNTQAHVGNGEHKSYTASFHNYLSILTHTQIFFRITPTHFVGMGYSWHLKNNEVAKTINKAAHTLRVSYMFHF